MTDSTVPARPRRDTRDKGWSLAGKTTGIYVQARAGGKRAWGYYDCRIGRVQTAASRADAMEKRAQAQLHKAAGLPAPDTRVRISDLAEEVRETKRRRLRRASFTAFEDALDRIVLPEVGHLKPAQLGPDRIARLIRDLETGKLTDGRKLSRDTVTKYLSPLAAIFALAIRRGSISASPMTLLSPDERPKNGTKRKRFEWSPESISKLLAAAEALDRRPEARQSYAPLVTLLALTGLRIGEALALRWSEVDLLGGVLRVEHSLGRDGELGPPKTDAGRRDVPLTPGLVDLLVRVKPLNAEESDFVFAGKRGRPVSYWNFRGRGFEKAAEEAGLDGVTVHDLRHAAASLYIASGLTPVEVASVLGHEDASTTLKVYAHLWDRSDVDARIRAAQEAVVLPGDDERSNIRTTL